MTLLQGDCLAILPTLETESIDSIVTDPPAGISFMGKGWDGDKGGRRQWVSWMAEVMAECLRVLKPGGHALVWALPRTSHWTATACEDAGFEIRDVIHHLFGSGFPKSHDISKAIDREAGAEREVTGKAESWNKPDSELGHTARMNNSGAEYNITAPATPEAKQWAGWGTALKPSNEIYLMLRKPLNPVPPSDILQATHEYLGDLLCLLSSNVKYVKPISELSPHVTSVVTSDSVQWPAVVNNIALSLSELGKTDMSKLQEVDKIFLSIARLWNSILDEYSKSGNKSTISTGIDPTTELKTLNSLILLITQDDTIRAETQENGFPLSVSIVASLLNAVQMKLQNIHQHFVPNNVTEHPESVQPYGNGQGQNSSRAGNGSENWILCRKPFPGTVAANVLEHGTGGLNIDAGRVEAEPYTRPKSKGTFQLDGCRDVEELRKLAASESRTPNGRNAATTLARYESMERGTVESNTAGRFPSNLILTHSAECGESCAPDCPCGEIDKAQVSGGSKGGKALHVAQNKVYNETVPHYTDNPASTGLPSSYFKTFRYHPKIAAQDREDGNTHATVKPTDLMRYFINLITPPKGTVLDCFMGSGSTGKAAILDGFDFVGIEQDPEYFKIAEARIHNAGSQPGLF